MKTGLLLLGAVLLGAFGAHFLMEDRGYVLLQFRGYSLEMSVPVLLLALILAYFAVRLTLRVIRTPANIGRAAGEYRARRARKNLARGLLALSEGEYSRGEKLLARGAHQSETPLLNYLSAARAAQRQRAPQRRDTWLRLAHELDPDSSNAVLLTQAELQLEDGQCEQALATLRKLDESAPELAQALALQALVYERLQDWASLRELLPRLARRKSLPEAELAALSVRVYREALADAGASGNAEAVRAIWRGLPRKLHGESALFRAYILALESGGAHDAAEAALRKVLKGEWDDQLVVLYGELDTTDPNAQLGHAEGWLKSRGDDAGLLLSAARISMRCELWGKARSYLESSLSVDPRVDTYQVYGKLLEHLGESGPAAGAFQAGLALATGKRVTSLPALRGPDSDELEADRPEQGDS